MPMTMPFEWAQELKAAKKRYADTREWRLICEYDAAGTRWSVRFPQMLLDWGNCHRVAIFEVQRYLTIFLTGFDCPERQLLLHKAIAELRRAEEAIAADKEPALAYADRDLELFGGHPFRWGRPHDPMDGEAPDRSTSAWPGWPAPRPELPADVEIGSPSQGASNPDTSEADGPSTAPDGAEPSIPDAPPPPSRPVPAMPPIATPLPGNPGWGTPSWASSPMPSAPSASPRPSMSSSRPSGFGGGGNPGYGGGRRGR